MNFCWISSCTFKRKFHPLSTSLLTASSLSSSVAFCQSWLVSTKIVLQNLLIRPWQPSVYTLWYLCAIFFNVQYSIGPSWVLLASLRNLPSLHSTSLLFDHRARELVYTAAVIVLRVTCDLQLHPIPFDSKLDNLSLSYPQLADPMSERIDILLGVDMWQSVRKPTILNFWRTLI